MSDLIKNDILKNKSVIRINQMDVCVAGVNGEWYLKIIDRKQRDTKTFLSFLRTVLVIRDLTVVLSDCEKIGNPVQISTYNKCSILYIKQRIKKV